MGSRIGMTALGIGNVLVGAVILAWRGFAFAFQAVPPDMPGHAALACAVGAAMVAFGALLAAGRLVWLAAAILAAAWAGLAIPWVLRVPRYPQASGVWGGLAEHLSLALAASMLAAAAVRPAVHAHRPVPRWPLVVYGCFSVVFALNHFLSLPQTAALVPQWLPLGGTFWALATGLGFAAGALALIADRLAALAARALGAMMAAIAVLVWTPRLTFAADAQTAWAGAAFSLALAAAALIVGEAAERRESSRERGSSHGRASEPGGRIRSS